MKYIIRGKKIITDRLLDYNAILSCGQTFRYREKDGGYEVISGEQRCFAQGNEIDCSCPQYFAKFFDLDTDYDAYIKSLIKFDELRDCIRYGSGIRILRQNLFEVIISFIISANNNIPRIRNIIEKICAFCGKDMGGYYAFPTPQELNRVTKEEFRLLGAGFRDTYLQKTAQILAQTDFLQKVESAKTNEAVKMLLSLPGVGPKVADCILLFGLRRWDCFPVDTWIFKQCQNDELNTPSKVRIYCLSRYKELAGLAQQYIFYAARSGK
ncbi:MAG: 8-oxoguanine DNA glycosylase [Clostridia bacterium]|nr:8-oxoguanine DNA glycosylase [Clostridia bacterium]